MVKPGSTFDKLVINLDSDLKDLWMSDVSCEVDQRMLPEMNQIWEFDWLNT
jgi:hypothetical protein